MSLTGDESSEASLSPSDNELPLRHKTPYRKPLSDEFVDLRDDEESSSDDEDESSEHEEESSEHEEESREQSRMPLDEEEDEQSRMSLDEEEHEQSRMSLDEEESREQSRMPLDDERSSHHSRMSPDDERRLRVPTPLGADLPLTLRPPSPSALTDGSNEPESSKPKALGSKRGGAGNKKRNAAGQFTSRKGKED